MNNIVFDVPLAAITHAETHVLDVYRDKWLIRKKKYIFYVFKYLFTIVLVWSSNINNVPESQEQRL